MSNYRNLVSPLSQNTSSIMARLSSVESRSMHGQIPIEWISADNFVVSDSLGNTYIDFTSAIFVANVGHGNFRVRSAVEEQLNKPLVTAYSYPTEIRAEYLEKLTSKSGIPNCKAFLLSAGTETTDAAVKLIKLWGRKTGKRRSVILSFSGNWHGRRLPHRRSQIIACRMNGLMVSILTFITFVFLIKNLIFWDDLSRCHLNLVSAI